MNPNIPLNPVLAKLPKHLFQYVHPQNYERYTPINQAVWRYVMRRNVDYLGKVAHDSYLEGLAKTGISTENIPCLLYTSPSPRDLSTSRMPSSA